MENFLPYLFLLACPVGMGLCMWMMARGMKGRGDSAEPTQSAQELRAQQQKLQAEIDRLAEHEDLTKTTAGVS